MKTFNFADRCLNKEQEIAFINGYEAKLEEIQSTGLAAARDSFNWANDNIRIYSSLGYAYSAGEMEALVDAKQKA